MCKSKNLRVEALIKEFLNLFVLHLGYIRSRSSQLIKAGVGGWQQVVELVVGIAVDINQHSWRRLS